MSGVDLHSDRLTRRRQGLDLRLVPASAQGSAQGLFQGLTGLGVLTAGVWAGLAWGQDGQLPLLVSGAAALIIATALPLVARTRTLQRRHRD